MTMESFFSTGYDLIALQGIGVVLAIVIFVSGLAIGIVLKAEPFQFIAGMMLKAVKPFRPGDTISGDGVTGTVESIRLFNTVLVTPDNATLFIPNINLMKSTIINHTSKGTRQIEVMFGLEHGGDVEAAIDIIEEVLSKDKRVLTEPCPRVTVAEYLVCGIVLIARLWVSSNKHLQIRSEIMSSVYKLFNEEDIHMHGVPPKIQSYHHVGE